MSLTIKRKKDNRVAKCLLHRVADIPGGVGVKTADLGGNTLAEGTPLGKGANGLFEVCKTAKVLTEANGSATKYEVAKGHQFRVGDYFATADCVGQTIKSIDRTNEAKDVIELSATLGKTVHANTCAFESNGGTSKLKVTPVCVAGSFQPIEQGTNLWVDAWVIGVVKEEAAPAVNELIKTAVKNIAFV